MYSIPSQLFEVYSVVYCPSASYYPPLSYLTPIYALCYFLRDEILAVFACPIANTAPRRRSRIRLRSEWLYRHHPGLPDAVYGPRRLIQASHDRLFRSAPTVWSRLSYRSPRLTTSLRRVAERGNDLGTGKPVPLSLVSSATAVLVGERVVEIGPTTRSAMLSAAATDTDARAAERRLYQNTLGVANGPHPAALNDEHDAEGLALDEFGVPCACAGAHDVPNDDSRGRQLASFSGAAVPVLGKRRARAREASLRLPQTNQPKKKPWRGDPRFSMPLSRPESFSSAAVALQTHGSTRYDGGSTRRAKGNVFLRARPPQTLTRRPEVGIDEKTAKSSYKPRCSHTSDSAVGNECHLIKAPKGEGQREALPAFSLPCDSVLSRRLWEALLVSSLSTTQCLSIHILSVDRRLRRFGKCRKGLLSAFAHRCRDVDGV
ncbi:hypothetical protein EV122DRAFT_285313 [Schizophyllum commune]